ncbi:MAG: HNH endonuclease signature motif containing protein [Algibacter sp.]
MKVRVRPPKRRKTPDKSEKGENHSKHKPNLEEDFHHHCGYCGAYDGFGYTRTYFEIDHFVPKDFLKKTNSDIGFCKYDNLVYSCRFCNNSKSDLWPSEDDKIHHKNNEGFVDPCIDDFDNHLYRTSDGAILWKTDLGKWMATQAFKFDERQEEIKVLWNYNQIRIQILDLVDLLNKEIEGSKEYIIIYEKLIPLNFKHFNFQKQLAEFYSNE